MRPKPDRPFVTRSRRHTWVRGAIAVLSVLLILPALTVTSAAARGRVADDAGVISDWNAIALATLTADPTKKAPETVVYLGFVQAAVYDAVVGIHRGYEPYLFHERAQRGSSAQAAAAAAAHEVLLTYSPYAQTALDAAYAASLAQIPDGNARPAAQRLGPAPRTT